MWLRCLPAISPLGGHLGCKLISASPRLRRAGYLIALFDSSTMRLAALLDGAQITGIRTAATAAVAIDALAPAKPLRVAVLGSGFEAKAQLRALAAARSVRSASVFSPTRENRVRFANDLGKSLSLPLTAMESAQDAVRDTDVVICAARAQGEIPVLRGEWLQPGMTIVSVGSTLPEQREVDADVIARCDAIVADVPEEVEQDTGDMKAAAREGVAFAGKLISLADQISGVRQARTTLDQIVVYKSVGGALQDVVIAELLYLEAVKRGLGTQMPVSIVPVAK
jgi:ornithine cyclodeaminase/alanine dehydrogenase